MREIIVLCIFACVAVISVQSATVYRNGREAAIEQLVEQIIKEEIVSELRKGEIPVAVENEPIIQLIKEDEFIAPVEALRNIEPVVQIQEQQPIVSEKVLSEPLAAVKTILIQETVEVIPEEPKKVEIVEAVKSLIPVEEKVEIVKTVEPVAEVPAPIVPALKSVIIEESVPVVVVTRVVESIESVRDNSAVKADEVVEEAAPVRPTIIETIQTFAQNIPIFRTTTAKADGEATAEATAKPPPNILEQFTSNIQNVFRPASNSAEDAAAAPAAAPASPIEAVQTFFQTGLSNIQNAFTNTQNAVTNALNPNRVTAEKKKETEKVSAEKTPVAEKTDVAAGKTVEKEEVIEPVKAVVEQIKSE